MLENGVRPGYIKLWQSGELAKRVEKARLQLTECNLCPHQCNINRKERVGFCRASDQVILSSYGPHFGEEDPLVGTNGSGTIFFAYCNLKCVFCQNCEISQGGEGRVVSHPQLADIMLTLQDRYRCHNINLVTPTHFVPNILEALLLAVEKGLKLPIVYNCGGYERPETLLLLDGVIDIYMPDFKYHFTERGERYSKVPDYPERVMVALKEMDRQVGGLKTDQGIAYQGLIIRHLVMPGGIEDTKAILKFIKAELSPDCLVNVMKQYYPAHQAHRYQEIAQRLSNAEYREALDYAKQLGLRLAD